MTTKCDRNLPFTPDDFKKGKTFAEYVSEAVAVGDLESDEKGSGARKNAGKPQLDLIPVRYWMRVWAHELTMESDLHAILERLMLWQEGEDQMLETVFEDFGDYMAETVRVLEFGAEKYKAWNWAKGMPWSVPTGCILRHAHHIVHGEDTDEESGCSHMAHIMCNVMMLAWYTKHYPEGDNRPPT